MVSRPVGAVPRERRGLVLAGVLMGMVTMALLAHAALLLARFEAAASRASLALTRARLAAESGLARTTDGLLPRGADSLEVGDTLAWTAEVMGAARFETRLRRLGRELWLIEATGMDGVTRGGSGMSVARSAAAWRLDPGERVRGVAAIVEIGQGAPASGPVDDTPWADPPPGVPPGACPGDPGTPPPPVAAVLDGQGGVPGLAFLTGEVLLASLDPLPGGVGTPTPVRAAGECRPGPWNWGDPGAAPGAPCGDRFVAARAPGDLTLQGGRGQGVLAVGGDLTLADGARFHGLALVGGALRVGAGSSFHGVARARGGLEADGDATVAGSACAVFRALDAATALSTLVPLPGWRRMGPWTEVR